MSHKHHHTERDFENEKKIEFLSVISLNLFISIAEIIAGIISQSMALVSDAFHNLEDTVSIIISYIAWIFSSKEPNFKRTYGYKRIEIIAAFVNSIFLIGICVFIILESIKRLIKPENINSDIMLLVSLFAFVINISCAYILHNESKNNLNWKASYLHMIGDSFFSLAILVGSFFIKKYNLYIIDPILSVLMSVFIIYQSISVLVKSFNILMQSGADLDYLEIKKDIEKIDGVVNVHHIHSWFGNEKTIYFEAHIEVKDCLVSQSSKIYSSINEVLTKKYLINHITLQFETDRCNNKELIFTNRSEK